MAPLQTKKNMDFYFLFVLFSLVLVYSSSLSRKYLTTKLETGLTSTLHRGKKQKKITSRETSHYLPTLHRGKERKQRYQRKKVMSSPQRPRPTFWMHDFSEEVIPAVARSLQGTGRLYSPGQAITGSQTSSNLIPACHEG